MSSRSALAAVTVTMLLVPPAMAETSPVKVGKAMLTFYWMVDESSARYHGGPEVALRDTRGHVIAHTTRKFRRALVLEGAGWLKDGRGVMYERKVRGEHRFRVVRAKYGYAVTGCALVPFRTAAVDPRLIKLGSKIYIPQLKGARLPDGTIHDGVFIAADRGHFRGRHVDLFVGEGPRGTRPFARRGYGSRSHVTVYLLERGGAGCEQ